jgi:hypothetical protein
MVCQKGSQETIFRIWNSNVISTVFLLCWNHNLSKRLWPLSLHCFRVAR